MTREEFLAALRQELVNVSEEERDEALKFYNEFLDEAGPDQEQKVIEELGTPHRVANIIRANLGLTGIAGVQDGAASAPPQPQPPVQEEAAVQKEEAAQEEAAAPEPQPAKAVPQLTLDGPDWAGQQARQEAREEGRARAARAAAGLGAAPDPAQAPPHFQEQAGAAYTSGPAYARGPAYAHGHPYDYSQDAGHRRPQNSNTWVWIVILVLTCPIWIGLLGGLVGLVFGLLGAVIGVGAGGIGAIVAGVASGVGALLGFVFGNMGPLDAMVDLGLGVAGVAIGSLLVGLCAWVLGKGVPAVYRMARRFLRGLTGRGDR